MPNDVVPQADMLCLRVLQIGLRWFVGRSAGGLERFYVDLFKSLPKAGIEFVGLVSGPDNVGALTNGRVRSFSFDGASMPVRVLGARQAINRILRAERLDLVACHFPLYAASALDCLHGRPLVCHFHGPWADESRCEGEGVAAVSLKRALEKLVYRRAKRVIVLSRASGEIAMRSYRVPEERLRVVPGSVDIKRFAIAETRCQARLLLGWPKDRPIVLTVRRLTARMGIDRLISAMVQIRHIEPTALLYIAGDGPLAEPLQRQVIELGLQNHVKFLGFVPDVDLPMAYRAADINVLPTNVLEGFGLSAAEALATGTPSMVTPVGGLPEVVADLSPNLVFHSSSSEDMAAGLSAALRRTMQLPDSASCRAYAATRFDPVLCAGRIAKIYGEVA